MDAKRLRLKRTPAEQIERDLRKARKAARKASGSRRTVPNHVEHTSSAAFHERQYDDDDNGNIFVRVEEERFQERLRNAMYEDDHVDGVQSQFNAYGARIPHRWRSSTDSGSGPRPWENEDTSKMDDEEYAEWVREGMWRRKNAAEQEEEERRRAAFKEAQDAAQRALKAKDEARARRRRERALRRKDAARDVYEARWGALLSHSNSHPDLRTADVPWPVFDGADIAPDTVSAFLLEPGIEKRDRLRQTLLRFHPDKFEARVLSRVHVEDKEQVKERMRAVVHAVGVLME